jgi:hypothetical protein
MGNEYSEIYGLRKHIDSNRQPRHIPGYHRLTALFASLDVPEPYNRLPANKEAWEKIFTSPDFSATCAGLNVADTALGNDSLYRVTSLDALLDPRSGLTLHSKRGADATWNVVRRMQIKTGNWMRLGAFFSGSLSGTRKLTWWTTADLSVNTFCTAHNTGIVDEWIASHAMILRLRSDNLPQVPAAIPTILDGFNQPIFYPTRDADTPTFGNCISLEALPLRLGNGKEVVFTSIPANLLDCMAIEFGRRPAGAHKVKMRDTLEHLVSFYKTL